MPRPEDGLEEHGNLRCQGAGIIAVMPELAVQPQGRESVAEAPDRYGETVSLGGGNYPRVHAVGDRLFEVPGGGVAGCLDVGMLLGLRQLGAEHESEVGGLLLGEGHVGAQQRAQCVYRGAWRWPSLRLGLWLAA